MVCATPQVRGHAKGQPATGTHAGYERHRRIGEQPCDPCRLAHNAWKKTLYDTNAEYSRYQSNWSRLRRLRLYGLTQDDYDRMLAAQGGCCAICKTSDPGKGTRFHVDHDHGCCPGTAASCGACIRGLLCNNCNKGLGQFRDDPIRLRAALEYLER